MNGKRNVTFVISDKWLAAIEKLIDEGFYASRSEIIREGVRYILLQNIDILEKINEMQYCPPSRGSREPRRHDIRHGISNEDIRKINKFLASQP